MKQNFLTKAYNRAIGTMVKHGPEMLAGMAIVGVATTVYFAIKDTPEAMEKIEEAKAKKIEEATVEEAREWSDNGGVPMKPSEIVKITWKTYSRTMISGAVTIGCILGSNTLHVRRRAALYSAYKLSETALREYQNVVREELGEEKEKQIEKKVAEKHIQAINFSEANIIYTGNGNILFREPISNQLFRSSKEAIRAAKNDTNTRILGDMCMCASLNDFLEYNKLPINKEVGDCLGWNIDKQCDIDFEPADTNIGEPCYEIIYTIKPTYDYRYDSMYR